MNYIIRQARGVFVPYAIFAFFVTWAVGADQGQPHWITFVEMMFYTYVGFSIAMAIVIIHQTWRRRQERKNQK